MTLPLPRAQSAYVDATGRPTTEFYKWLQSVERDAGGQDAALALAIRQIAEKLGSADGSVAGIPNVYPGLSADTNIIGEAGQIQVAGSLSGGTVVLGLDELADAGGGEFRLIDRDEFGRIAGSTLGTAADVPADDAGWEIISGTDVQAALDSADNALLDLAETGVRFGGVGTVDGGIGVGTTVSVTAGRGSILDTTNPLAPTYTEVDWPAFPTQALDFPGSVLTWWYIDAAGDLQQTTTAPTRASYRERIWLFRTGFVGGAITSLVSIPAPTQQAVAQTADLARSLGTIINDGLRPTPNGANLKITRTAGSLISWGGNYATDADDPHAPSFPLASPLSFRMILSTGAPIPPPITDLPVGFYEAGGVVTAIPGATNRASIFTVYQLPSGNAIIQYDQTFYTSIAEAQTALTAGRVFTQNSLVPEADGIVSGYIIAQKGATNLSDATQAKFFLTDRFGSLGGSGVANTVATWGGITGTLSDQADLQAALDDKLDVPTVGTADDSTFLRGDGVWSNVLDGPITVRSGADIASIDGVNVQCVTSGSAVFGASSVGRLVFNNSQTADATIDFNPQPADGTSSSQFRFFRAVNTTGLTSLNIHPGDGTAAVNHRLFGKGGSSFIGATSGRVLLKTATNNLSGADIQFGSSATPSANITQALGNATLNWNGVYSNAFYSGASQVVGARRTGWAAATGTATRTTFDTATVTTAQLAERMKALLDDLIAHGLIGA